MCEGSKEPWVRFGKLFNVLTNMCETSNKRIVLIIDEVDSASNNQVFFDFLSQLRDRYIARYTEGISTFHAVILAGVSDLKRLNSPWNIADDFLIDMSLSEAGIKGMLDEYEDDHHTGMDTTSIAVKIRDDTNGYPFLVSRICRMIDERLVPGEFSSLHDAWTLEGVEMAVKLVVSEKNTLFDSLMGKLEDYPVMKQELKRVLFQGETMDYRPDDIPQEQLLMYGFVKNRGGTVLVDNRIFEMRLYRYYASESVFAKEMREEALEYKPMFIKDGILDVPLIMKRFIKTQEMMVNMTDNDARRKFIEEEGREKFLTYIAPILNGVGTFSIEERTRNKRRMDVVIHYRGQRYIIELKIWRGERYNSNGEKQISDYLDSFGLTVGYMLSFLQKKKPCMDIVHVNGKLLYEGIV